MNAYILIRLAASIGLGIDDRHARSKFLPYKTSIGKCCPFRLCIADEDLFTLYFVQIVFCRCG